MFAEWGSGFRTDEIRGDDGRTSNLLFFGWLSYRFASRVHTGAVEEDKCVRVAPVFASMDVKAPNR